MNGAETIGADVREGGLRDAIEHAAGANSAHGAKRSQADVARVIEGFLRDDEWGRRSNAWLGKMVGVDKNTIEKHRRRLESTCEIHRLAELLGEDGKVRPRRIKQPKAPTPEASPDPSPVATPDRPRSVPVPEPESKPTDGEQLGLTGATGGAPETDKPGDGAPEVKTDPSAPTASRSMGSVSPSHLIARGSSWMAATGWPRANWPASRRTSRPTATTTFSPSSCSRTSIGGT